MAKFEEPKQADCLPENLPVCDAPDPALLKEVRKRIASLEEAPVQERPEPYDDAFLMTTVAPWLGYDPNE